MRTLFADTFFWIAYADLTDDWHDRVEQTYIEAQPCKLVTTDEVLGEVLTFYSTSGKYVRQEAASLIRAVLSDSSVDVRPQTRQSFISGLSLYAQRLDKGYSIADCVSMNTMKQFSITEVLTRDKHFSQEGFIVLFREDR